MSPAQRKNRSHRRSDRLRRKRPGGNPFVRIVVAVLLTVGIFVLLSFQTRFWDGNSKLTLAANTKEGNIIISSFDPGSESVTNIFIPGSTQLNVSRQLGSWRAKSIWQLGINEKLSGALLRETVVKNFYLPVVAWGDAPALAFSQGDFLGVAKAIVFPFKTNLKIGDKIKLGIFALSVKNPKRTDLDLRQGNYLKKARLTDGEEGYIPTGTGMEKLIVYFTDSEISRKNLRVEIKDASGGSKVSQEVGRVVEIIGAKVSSVSKVEAEDSDCEVVGKDRKLVEVISSVFSCQKGKGLPSGNFDAQVKLGKGFVGRY